ncbi:MAG: DEAD/DEAH box helicase, partial [bacterium]|nr:DEAD/DEAH box helicase [bacterium]
MNLNTPIRELDRLGESSARQLHSLNIHSVHDLLYYFPIRYDDYHQNILIKDLKEGMNAVVRGRINLIAGRRSWKTKKTITEALVEDASGAVRVIWFNQPYLIKTFKIGDEITLSGKVSMDMLGLQFVSPAQEKSKKIEATTAGRLVPIYPLTGNITEKQMRSWVAEVIPIALEILEWLPVNILDSEDLVPLSEAVRGLHFPTDEKDHDASLRRVKFDELFLLQLRVVLQRNRREREKAIPLIFKENETKQFVKDLSFALTKAQKVSAWEILRDLEKEMPMNRLLSGDVGSGKTVVAALASYNAFLNGVQTAFMAPTEILAFQHFQSLQKMFGETIVIGLFTRSQCVVNTKGEIKKREMLALIENGEIQIIVGTHALLSEKVDFKKLGLVVVDEQHRFGVEQRKILKEKMGKKLSPHFLSM